jgi:hypothetical protein
MVSIRSIIIFIVILTLISCKSLRISNTSKVWVIDSREKTLTGYFYYMHSISGKYYMRIELDRYIKNDTVNFYEHKNKLIIIQ